MLSADVAAVAYVMEYSAKDAGTVLGRRGPQRPRRRPPKNTYSKQCTNEWKELFKVKVKIILHS